MEIFALLRSVTALESFDDQALRRLAEAAHPEEFSSGQIIRRRGQRASSVGVVVSGRVEVRLETPGGESEAVEMPPGKLFGEMGLLTGEPAVADVVAVTPSRILLIPEEAIGREISINPMAARGLARLLAEHLRHRSEDPEEQERVGRASILPDGHVPGTTTMTEPILVLNLGSSSIKYALFLNRRKKVSGIIEMGSGSGRVRHLGPHGVFEKDVVAEDHETGLGVVFDLIVHPEHGAVERLSDLAAVGHRVVHGGTRFAESTLVTAAVKKAIEHVGELAPLHNPINLRGIELAERLLPAGIPQVAVFDTSFHMTMPEHAFRYALPRRLADRHNLRRFGFHGTSHKYVSKTACAFLDVPASSLKIVSCHLGNGASVTAVDHGRSVDTSMGLTPLEGLIMGTRSGDLDPGLVLYLLRLGMTGEEVDSLCNEESGLLGLSGLSSDMRELEKAADAGHPGALLAIQAFCYRIRKYIGAFVAAMGGLDALVFTGGIGEGSVGVRSRVCGGLAVLGISLDERANREAIAEGALAKLISADDSSVKILVVPTDEEGMIAVETTRALERSGVGDILTARRDRPIPIGVSAHHVHLTEEHTEQLFGPGHRLTPRSELSQPGQYACEETVDLLGPKGTVERVRVLGPERKRTQVEISRTEEFRLGIDAPIRASGDLEGTPGLTLKGPEGSVILKEGVICALRHIHMSPEDALIYGLKDKDVVRVKLEGERSLIFGDVLIRVHPSYRLEMHIDTDEANAAEVTDGMTACIDSIQRRST